MAVSETFVPKASPPKVRAPGARCNYFKIKVPLTGLEPVLSALRGRRVNHLHHSGKLCTSYCCALAFSQCLLTGNVPATRNVINRVELCYCLI